MIKITTTIPMIAPTITPVLLDEPESPEESSVDLVSPGNPESSPEGILVKIVVLGNPEESSLEVIMVDIVVGIAVVPVVATMERRKKITSVELVYNFFNNNAPRWIENQPMGNNIAKRE